MGVKKEKVLLKKRILSRKNLKNFKEEADYLLNEKVNNVTRAELEDGTIIYIIEKEVAFAIKETILFPTLNNNIIEKLPSVIVDMGAIPYVCKGADIMSPGIVEVKGEFDETALVIVRDVNHGKALSVGKALVSSKNMKYMPKGKAIKNLHYVGDKIWGAI